MTDLTSALFLPLFSPPLSLSPSWTRECHEFKHLTKKDWISTFAHLASPRSSATVLSRNFLVYFFSRFMHSPFSRSKLFLLSFFPFSSRYGRCVSVKVYLLGKASSLTSIFARIWFRVCKFWKWCLLSRRVYSYTYIALSGNKLWFSEV